MSDKPQDLKLRTKAFALGVIRMYSKLSKNDTLAQVLGNLESAYLPRCVPMNLSEVCVE